MAAERDRKRNALGSLKGFMFDLDGTLVLTDRSLDRYHLLPGAVDVLRELSSRSVPFVVFTNGTARSEERRVGKEC